MCSTCVNARPHYRLMSSFQRIHANIRKNLISLETGVTAEQLHR